MSSKQIGIEDARKTLGPLVDEACRGTEIVLTRHGQPVARITHIEEPTVPTVAEHLATFRRMSTVPTIVDTLDREARNPAGWLLAQAQVTAETAPFAKLIADIDAFFGDELDGALAGDEAAEAEAEARRIIAENLAAATMRLALSAAGGSQVTWAAADTMTLQHLTAVAIQRAADLRFVEVVSPAAKRVAV